MESRNSNESSDLMLLALLAEAPQSKASQKPPKKKRKIGVLFSAAEKPAIKPQKIKFSPQANHPSGQLSYFQTIFSTLFDELAQEQNLSEANASLILGFSALFCYNYFQDATREHTYITLCAVRDLYELSLRFGKAYSKEFGVFLHENLETFAKYRKYRTPFHFMDILTQKNILQKGLQRYLKEKFDEFLEELSSTLTTAQFDEFAGELALRLGIKISAKPEPAPLNPR